jgi:type VI secretion system secreted protein VgrG
MPFPVVVTPVAGNEFLLLSLHGTEAMGRAFEFDLELLSKTGGIKPGAIVGQNMTVTILETKGGPRHFNGFVTRFSQAGTEGNYNLYRATLQPWVWFLKQTSDCRLFQSKSVPDIVQSLFKKHGYNNYELHLEATHEPVDYAVQYRETDFNFVSRLLEGAGIAFHFTHEIGKHTMILTDSAAGRQYATGYKAIELRQPTESGKEECFTSWRLSQEVKTAGYVLRDYDYLKPRDPLVAMLSAPGTADKHLVGEMYDFPGGYIKSGDGNKIVSTRLQEAQSLNEIARAEGDVRGIAPGNIFGLGDNPWAVAATEYLIVSCDYTIKSQPPESGKGGDGEDFFRCNVSVLDTKIPYRPARLTPKPLVHGPQTGVVVGANKNDKDAEEVWTDKYARVLVRFHWERLGAEKASDSTRGDDDTKNALWMRVSQLWAGAQWGAIFIPRVGQEVIVEFLDGDPDRPIVTGRVYNADQMPPYELPANKTQSGIKTRSMLKGGPANFNEIRFEDKKGSEELYFHAEKDHTTIVENDETRTVGHDRDTEIGNDETILVKGMRTETVEKDESITINGARSETVEKDENVTITGGRMHDIGKNDGLTVGDNHAMTVGKNDTTTVGGNQTLTVDKDQSITISGTRTVTVTKDDTETYEGKRTVTVKKEEMLKVEKKMLIDVTDEITIKTGQSSITMKKDGTITIKGKDITVDASGKVTAKASSDMVLKGSKIAQN